MSARRSFALLSLALLACTPVMAAPISPSPAPAHSAAGEDIRDIRGPISIAERWRWLVLGGGALAIAALGAALTFGLRRRRVRPLTADERALARLDEARILATAGRPREYAAAASDAVRAYIEERFGLGATHATTEEFLQTLAAEERSPLGDHRRPLLQFLSACDLAKFARYQLPLAGMSSLNELARQFVITTAQPPRMS